jgi:hypothetical protein
MRDDTASLDHFPTEALGGDAPFQHSHCADDQLSGSGACATHVRCGTTRVSATADKGIAPAALSGLAAVERRELCRHLCRSVIANHVADATRRTVIARTERREDTRGATPSLAECLSEAKLYLTKDVGMLLVSPT